VSAVLSRERLNHRLAHHCDVEVWCWTVGGTKQQLSEACKPASISREVITGEVGPTPSSLKAEAAKRCHSLLIQQLALGDPSPRSRLAKDGSIVKRVLDVRVRAAAYLKDHEVLVLTFGQYPVDRLFEQCQPDLPLHAEIVWEARDNCLGPAGRLGELRRGVCASHGTTFRPRRVSCLSRA